MEVEDLASPSDNSAMVCEGCLLSGRASLLAKQNNVQKLDEGARTQHMEVDSIHNSESSDQTFHRSSACIGLHSSFASVQMRLRGNSA